MLQLGQDDRQAVIQRSQEDPLFFPIHYMGMDLWKKQREIVEMVHGSKESAIRSCHAIGKTTVGATCTLSNLCPFEGSQAVTTAPNNRQVEHVTWKEIRKQHRDSRFPIGGHVTRKGLRFSDDWFGLGFATEKDGDMFVGFHSEVRQFVLADEASGVSDVIFDEGIMGVLTGNTRFMTIGNPTNPNGYFYRQFKEPGVAKMKISAWDTPNFTEFGIEREDIVNGTWQEKVTGPLPRPYLVDPEWVARMFRKWCGGSRDGLKNPLWVAKVEADFPEDLSDKLIPLAWVEAAKDRWKQAKRHPAETDKRTLGVDVARKGTDESVIVYRHGFRASVVYSSVGEQDTMRLVGHTVRLRKKYGSIHPMAAVNVDEIGVGGGVVDRLAELREPVFGVNVAESPEDKDMFVNKRAEIYWNLRELFEHGEIDIDPNDEDLTAQLVDIQFKYTSQGKIQIESKDDAKRRGISSPDRVDALALAFAPQKKARFFV